MPNLNSKLEQVLERKATASVSAILIFLVLSGALSHRSSAESWTAPQNRARVKVRIGCKEFTESYIMAEYLAQQLEHRYGDRVEVIRRYGLGSTAIAFQALTSGAIDVYPEYTGTVLQVTGKSSLELALQKASLVATQSLGFTNSYGLALTKTARSQRLGSNSDQSSVSIADLERDGAQFESLRIGLSYEFFGRSDGWPLILKKYPRFNQAPKPTLMDHSLLYTAAANQKEQC